MNLVEISLVTIISSAAIASGFSAADKQTSKIKTQQEQTRCLQQSFDNIASQNNLFELARQQDSLQNFEEKCKLQAEG